MRKFFPLLRAGWLIGGLLSGAFSASSQVDVLTHHYNNDNSGLNASETVLTVNTVNTTSFGKLYEYPVTGQVYAQPLYVGSLTIGGKTRNVLVVATMHNDVYAFDADDAASAGAPLWHVTLGQSVRLKSRAIGGVVWQNYNDISTEIGITSTPVIDKSSNTVYVVTKTDETAYPNGVFDGSKTDTAKVSDRLHALDLLTGAEKSGSPVTIRGSVPGNGNDDGPPNGLVEFHSCLQNQRPALKLSPDRGRVYIAFASYGDNGAYHGWLFGYNTGNLAERPLIFCTTPEGGQASIWMSGAGPAIDSNGDLYVITGNGSFDTNGANRKNYGESFLRLSPNPGSGSFDVRTFFTPYNQQALNDADLDLGSDGPVLLPGNLVTGSGKEGRIYLLNRTAMGGYDGQSDAGAVQAFKAFDGHLHGTTVFLPTTGNDGYSYWWSEQNYARRYDLTGGKFNTTPVQGNVMANTGMPGGHLTVTVNGSVSDANPAILWACIPTNADANQAVVAGTLRAFNGNTMKEIYNSDQAPNGADAVGNFAKFVSPTVTNGRVYVATFSNKIVVYGAKGGTPPPPPNPPTLTASAPSTCPGQTVTLTASGCSGTVNWSNGASGGSTSVGPGTYTATCTVGGQTSAAAAITVGTASNCGPVVTCVLTKVRLFPRANFANRLNGGRIQGYSAQSGTWTDLLTVANAVDGWNEFSVSTQTAYSQYRYYSPDGGYCNVAEVEFYNGSAKLVGTAFGDSGGAWSGSGNTFDKAFDGNTATFYDANNASGGYVGLQLTGCGDSQTAALTVSNTGGVQNVAATANTGSFTVNSTNVSWTIGNAPAWASVSPTSGGTGSTTVSVSFGANPDAAARSATLTVSGGGLSQSVVISQQGTPVSGGTGCVINRVRLKFVNAKRPEHLVGATIQASNDNVNWMTLYTIGVNGTGDWQEFTFGNTTTYQWVRFVASATGNGELAELEFYNGSNRLTGTGFGSPGKVDAGTGWPSAFDGNEATVWFSDFPGTTNFVGLQLTGCGTSGGGDGGSGTACAPNRIRLKFVNAKRPEHLVGATIQASNDNVSWTTLYTIGVNGTGDWQEFTFGNTTTYQWVRFVASATGNGELAELEFYNGTTRLSGTGFGSPGKVDASTGWPSAFDGNEATVWFSDFPGTTNFAGLQLTGCGTTGGNNRLAAGVDFGQPLGLSVEVSPNPSTGQVRARVNLPADGPARLSLLTPTGRVLVDQEWNGEAGENLLDVDCRRQPNGLYLLRVESGGRAVVKKLLKVAD
jgi:hypothetical protein